jgi:ComF family protein
MTFFKTLKRGYNQSEFIAKIVGKKCNIPYQKSLLKKKNHTRQQSHLSRQERKENIKNCFQINKKYRDIIDKKNIIVVDDVISTGATMNEVAKVLKQNGANKVI